MATATGSFANGADCMAMDSLTVEQIVQSDEDNDNVANDIDVCPGTVIPEFPPTKSLGVNQFALMDDWVLLVNP